MTSTRRCWRNQMADRRARELAKLSVLPRGTEYQAVVLDAADLAVSRIEDIGPNHRSDARAFRPCLRVPPHGLADQVPGAPVGEQQRAAETRRARQLRNCGVPIRLDHVRDR